MEPGSVVTVTIVSQVSTLARGRVTNSADLSANETERNRANNTAIAVTPILADTDLSVTQSVAPPSAVAGLPFTYTILVRNSGPEPAHTVQLYDRLPEGISLSSAPTSCSLDGTFLVCAIGDMAAGTTRSVVIVTRRLARDQGLHHQYRWRRRQSKPIRTPATTPPTTGRP